MTMREPATFFCILYDLAKVKVGPGPGAVVQGAGLLTLWSCHRAGRSPVALDLSQSP